MEILLTPELEDAIAAKVNSGLYRDASEVIRESLRQTILREREMEWLAHEAAIGFTQLESAQTRVISSKDAFFAMVRDEA